MLKEIFKILTYDARMMALSKTNNGEIQTTTKPGRYNSIERYRSELLKNVTLVEIEGLNISPGYLSGILVYFTIASHKLFSNQVIMAGTFEIF